jgi:hypothetical protein
MSPRWPEARPTWPVERLGWALHAVAEFQRNTWSRRRVCGIGREPFPRCRLYPILPRNGLPFVFHRFVRSHGTKSALRTSPGDDDRIAHAASCFPFGIQRAVAPVPWHAMRTNRAILAGWWALFPMSQVRNLFGKRCGRLECDSTAVSTTLSHGASCSCRPARSLTDSRSARASTGRGACVGAELVADLLAVWNQPYLETCCRAALHRLYLSAPAGRPAGQMDEPCQLRLEGMGLCQFGGNGRFTINQAGQRRHAIEVLKLSSGPTIRTGSA